MGLIILQDINSFIYERTYKTARAICVPTLRDKLTASVLNELLVGIWR